MRLSTWVIEKGRGMDGRNKEIRDLNTQLKHIVAPLLSLLILAGCSLFEGEDSSEVQLSIHGNSVLLRRVIQVRLTALNWVRSLDGRDFGSGEWPNYTQTIATPKIGILQVDVTLKDSANKRVSFGAITLDIRSDWRWGVDISLVDKNPTEGCFGCFGYKVFSVDSIYQRTPEDSLYLVWGGNWIKHPVLY
jgi:hypothetical protein